MYKELYCCEDYLVSDEGFVLNKKGTAPLKYYVIRGEPKWFSPYFFFLALVFFNGDIV